MDHPITIDDVHPSLRSVVKEFLLKCKYPFRLELAGVYQPVRETPDGEFKDYRTGVSFIDPAYPHLFEKAGKLMWHLTPHLTTVYVYRTVSRNTLHQKFNDSERRRAVDTADPKRAVRVMLQHITPLTLREVAAKSRRIGEALVGDWRSEFIPKELDLLGTLSRKSMYEEFTNLLSQNVTFVTKEFQAVVETGLHKYEQWEKRRQTDVTLWYVHFSDNGIMVLNPQEQMGRFTAFELLPDFIQEAVSMVNLSPSVTHIPGFVTQVNPTDYWVMKKG